MTAIGGPYAQRHFPVVLYRRVGDTSGGVFTHAGFETIDASKAAPLLRSFRHSYIFDSGLVLADLEDALINRL